MPTVKEAKLDARQYARNMNAAKKSAKAAPMLAKLRAGKARMERAQYQAELLRENAILRRRVAAMEARR